MTANLVTPTIDDLCKEAFNRVAGREPTAQQLERAVHFWFEEVLAEIWHTARRDDTVRLKSLENTAYLLLTEGQRRYDIPEDFDKAMGVFLGNDVPVKGTVSAGGILQFAPAFVRGEALGVEIEAAMTEALGDDYAGLDGKTLTFIDGDAAGRSWTIVSATLAASSDEDLNEIPIYSFNISPPFDTPIPHAADSFVVGEDETEQQWFPVEDAVATELDMRVRSGTGLPTTYNIFDRKIEFDVAADEPYQVELRYWVNPLKINKTSDVMKEIVTNWRLALTCGLKKLTAEALDDNRLAAFTKEFHEAVVMLIEHESNYGVECEGFRV